MTTPATDIRTRAADLINHYGSLERIVRAAKSEFVELELLTGDEVALLTLLHEVLTNLLRVRALNSNVCSNPKQLLEYLQLSLSTERREQTRIILLDSHNGIIADEAHTFGTINFTALHPREVVKRALVHNAAGLIIVHNHPSGDPRPSVIDLQRTSELREILRQIDVSLVDHVIVGRHTTVSLRELDALDGFDTFPGQGGTHG